MPDRRVNGWDFLTLALWSIFFAAGLVPEPVFIALRYLANVPTQNAIVNSSFVITVAFSIFFAVFVRRRCIESGLTPAQAQSRAIQAMFLAILAFLEIPQSSAMSEGRTLLYLVVRSQYIEDMYLKSVVLAAGAAKLLAWWYLFSLLLRYHAFGDRHVFAKMPPFLPSARVTAEPRTARAALDDATPEPESPAEDTTKLHSPR